MKQNKSRIVYLPLVGISIYGIMSEWTSDEVIDIGNLSIGGIDMTLTVYDDKAILTTPGHNCLNSADHTTLYNLIRLMLNKGRVHCPLSENYIDVGLDYEDLLTPGTGTFNGIDILGSMPASLPDISFVVGKRDENSYAMVTNLAKHEGRDDIIEIDESTMGSIVELSAKSA